MYCEKLAIGNPINSLGLSFTLFIYILHFNFKWVYNIYALRINSKFNEERKKIAVADL